MTVKDLFFNVGFETIVKALQNTHRNDKSIKCFALYKEAFDIICNTEFKGEGGEVTFEVTPRDDWYAPHSLPLLANNVEGDNWGNTVGKTVIRPDDNPFTDAELAGAILWGMTFYGFTQHHNWSPFEKRYTRYGEMAEKLKRRLYLPYILDKRVKRDLRDKKDMPFGIAFTHEVWNQIHFREERQNRAKRKRFYRIKHRISELERLDKRQHLIDTITHKTGIPEQDIKSRIMRAGSILESWRESHVYGKSSRIDYLIDLLTKFIPTFDDLCDECDEMIVIAYTSKESPLTDDESKCLNNALSSIIEKREVSPILLSGTDCDTKGEIALQIIRISPIKPREDDEDE